MLSKSRPFIWLLKIGHYNVIPLPVEYFFFYHKHFPAAAILPGYLLAGIGRVHYTFIIDKRPEGIVLHLKEGENLINVFPHAFFPDSSMMFFKDVTSYIDVNKGDTLEKVLMVGKGFTGFDKGLHEFNGEVTGLRIYKYILSDASPGYEMEGVRKSAYRKSAGKIQDKG